MAQLTYAINIPAVTYPGQLADLTRNAIQTALAAAAAIVYGTLVVRDTVNSTGAIDGVCGRAPASSGDVTTVDGLLGIAVADQARAQDPSVATAQYPINSAVSCLYRGRIWVKTEGAVTEGNSPFVRFAAGGGGTVLGSFRADADTATAVALPNAVYLTSTSGAGFAIVSINEL